MTDRLKRLKIDGFRGATQPLDLEFDPKKPVVLIFGENGSGKSTIVDAIEAAGSGSMTFQNDWKVGRGKVNFTPALGKKLSDVSIAMEFGNETYSAKLDKKGVQLCTTPARPITKVLRRKSLQAFMDSVPSERYKEIEKFLDIPQIESSEASLREALKEAKKQFESATAAYGQAAENLQGLWEAEGSPGMDQKLDAKTWGRQRANIPTDELQARLDKSKRDVQLSNVLIAQAEARVTLQQQVEQTQVTLKQAQQALMALESSEAQSSSELVTLLQDAKTYLEKTPDSLCPVCEETTIVPDQLAQRLQQRLDDMNVLAKASNARQAAQIAATLKQGELKNTEEKLLDDAQAAQQHFYPEVEAQNSIQQLRQYKQEQVLAHANELHDEFVAGREKFQASFDETQKQINTLSGIQQLVTSLEEKSAEAEHKETLSKRLQLAVDVVEAHRKSYVEDILTDIAQSVDELYQKIHPQEGIGNIKLKLDENQRGSLIYGVAFGGQQDIHPQPYYSESHLDTLGLCIFIALAKRTDAARTLVVLDDVLGSADQQHLQRMLTMLMEESLNFAQVIFTTHYRPLRDQFRFARQPTVPVQLIELKAWDFFQGIKSGKTLTYVDDLRKQLQEEDFRRESIAAQAGILFESLLEFITKTYRCKVPHLIEPRFTFGDLESSPNNKLKQVLKIVKKGNNGDTEEIMLVPIYEQLKQAIQIRNLIGCHFNQWVGELSDQEVREMAELALNLADTLVCQHCGSLPLSNKSGSHWECSCKETQMHPLQQPQ